MIVTERRLEESKSTEIEKHQNQNDGALSLKLHYLQGEALPLGQSDPPVKEASWLT
jgi:hypothetical protein